MQRMNLSTVQKAEIALDNFLYIPGWAMVVMFRHALRYPDMYRIELHEEHGEYVAALCVLVRSSPTRKANKYTAALFVEDAYRRKGIGTKLLARLGDDIRKCKAGRGITGSLDFWRANKVTCFSENDLEVWNDKLNDIEAERSYQKELDSCSTKREPYAASKTSCIATKSDTTLASAAKRLYTRIRSSPKESSCQSL